MSREAQRQALEGWFPDHPEVLAFIDDVGAITQTWDDLHDGDRQVSQGRLFFAFWRAISGLQRNTFYQRHIGELLPVFELGMLDWHAANVMEAGGKSRDLYLSYVLRDSIVGLVVSCARIVHGAEPAYKLAPEIRRLFHHDEPVGEYFTEHWNEETGHER